MYRVGIVGPTRGIKRIEEAMIKYFDQVSVVPLVASSPSDFDVVVKAIKLQEKTLDGLIFTNKNPYDLLNNAMIPSIPWIFVEKNSNHLQQVLLEIFFTTDYDPRNVSIDYFDRSAILGVYEEVGVSEEELKLYNMGEILIDDDTFDKMLNFHKHNYYHHKVSVCITGMTQIYEKLTADGIPCFYASTTNENIMTAIKNLDFKLKLQVKEQSQIVIIAIEIDRPSEYSVINENPYHMMTQKTKVTEQVYLFAQRIQAKVIETGTREYLLFTTRALLESVTHKLEHLSLLDDVVSQSSHTISMGIGYGKTAREADYNAQLGKKKAIKNGGNMCFAAHNGKYIGPIINRYPDENIVPKIDEKYMNISERTGVGIDTIFNLQCFLDKRKDDHFTPKELAEYMEKPLRNINRLLVKFESAGYLSVVGKKSLSPKGRPSRIVKLNFDK